MNSSQLCLSFVLLLALLPTNLMPSGAASGSIATREKLSGNSASESKALRKMVGKKSGPLVKKVRFTKPARIESSGIYNASGIAGNSDGQLTPDRVLADAGNLTTAASATPIPPVVSGIVVLEEFKPRNTVELKSLAVAHV